ncbi:uncharacterized protein LOC116455829 [Corvus moneduloides]|uniref:uncharacterized protein LOC116455829 n=1 Tax=Corvus moneduloides TaxID=1196302 RepID=UPI001362FB00|nr:uncharacterized protein LOC116455829 [Corvus moneduloides]
MFLLWSLRSHETGLQLWQCLVSAMPVGHPCQCCLPEVGKQEVEREGPPCDDTKSDSIPSDPGSQHLRTSTSTEQHFRLQPATLGSLGLDLAISTNCTLIDNRPQRVPTGIKGPIIINGKAVGALLIGRSSATMEGLQILTGLIDADYTGEIQIMVQTLFPPMFIEKGTRLPQLVPLPVLTEGLSPIHSDSRGEGAFGSTGPVAMLTVSLKSWPRRMVAVTYQGQTVTLCPGLQ